MGDVVQFPLKNKFECVVSETGGVRANMAFNFRREFYRSGQENWSAVVSNMQGSIEAKGHSFCDLMLGLERQFNKLGLGSRHSYVLHDFMRSEEIGSFRRPHFETRDSHVG